MAKMPPPGSAPGHGVAIVISPSHDAGGKMPPPGMGQSAGGGKSSPEEAGVVRSDAHCIDCENYAPDTGSCAKVQGTFSPDDACSKYFEPVNDDESSESPDADDQSSGSTDQGQMS
jgi:hypothetical protein